MKKSKFNLTHLHSATLDAGYLVPFLLQPTLPNDTFRIGLSTFLRAQPMLAPLMHEVYLNTQYWFVPYRLLWDSWEDFITGGSDLSSTPNFPVVTSTAEDVKVGSLWDYFGFPLQAGVEVSALPFRALAEIWNTRYRDEDLQQEVPVSYASGNDTTTNRKLLSPCISKDYFSVSRPFTQRGADIFVPIASNGSEGRPVFHEHTIRGQSFEFLGFTPQRMLEINPDVVIKKYVSTQAGDSWNSTPVEVDISEVPLNQRGEFNFYSNSVSGSFPEVTPVEISLDNVSTGSYWYRYPVYAPDSVISGTNYNNPIPNEFILYDSGGGTGRTVYTASNITGRIKLTLVADKTVNAPGVVNKIVSDKIIRSGNAWRFTFLSSGTDTTEVITTVTLSASGSLSVRDLRESSALQRYAERSLKYGNRYEEFIQREFGISPRDSRIQRPEYLGGGRGMLNISEVLQTAESTDTGVGTMRGHGIGAITQRRIKFRSPEHGIIIGLLSIRPKIVYTQGIDREFLKRSRLDFFTPELANIGMQEVLTQEIFANSSNKGSVFGYSDRYQEYRYHKPLVTGEFRGNLNFWNMALEFATQPELNAEFVNMKTYAENWKRPFQVQDNSAHAFVCMIKNHIRAYRPIPKRAKDILK